MVRKMSKNGSKNEAKIDPKNRPGPDILRTETPSNEACFRKMAEKDCLKNGRKIVFSRPQNGPKNGPKMVQKSTKNRGRKMGYQAQTTLKIEKWTKKLALKMGRKMGRK